MGTLKIHEVGAAVGSLAGCQNGAGDAAKPAGRRGSQATAPALAPVLLTEEQAAELWGIGKTLFYELRASGAEWFPRPVKLSARVVRYVRAEVEAAVEHMPRLATAGASEPAQLLRARIERQKRSGMPA